VFSLQLQGNAELRTVEQSKAQQSNSDRAYANEPLPNRFGSSAEQGKAAHSSAQQRKATRIGHSQSGTSEVFSSQMHGTALQGIAKQRSAAQSNSVRGNPYQVSLGLTDSVIAGSFINVTRLSTWQFKQRTSK